MSIAGVARPFGWNNAKSPPELASSHVIRAYDDVFHLVLRQGGDREMSTAPIERKEVDSRARATINPTLKP